MVKFIAENRPFTVKEKKNNNNNKSNKDLLSKTWAYLHLQQTSKYLDEFEGTADMNEKTKTAFW